MGQYASLDLETADGFSICAVGIVLFDAAGIQQEIYQLIDPQTLFNEICMTIHNITPEMVEGQPTFDEFWPKALAHLTSRIVTHHTNYDPRCIHEECYRYGIEPPDLIWLDTAKVARRAWEDCAKSGYGLYDVCTKINFSFRHHHALEDARASRAILLAACQLHNMTIEEWLARTEKPIKPPVHYSGIQPDAGPLHGEEIVFTGTLTKPRTECASAALALGATVKDSVTKHTTILVCGGNSIQTGSEKMMKALKWREKGKPIRIIPEPEFWQFLTQASARSSPEQ